MFFFVLIEGIKMKYFVTINYAVSGDAIEDVLSTVSTIAYNAKHIERAEINDIHMHQMVAPLVSEAQFGGPKSN